MQWLNTPFLESQGLVLFIGKGLCGVINLTTTFYEYIQVFLINVYWRFRDLLLSLSHLIQILLDLEISNICLNLFHHFLLGTLQDRDKDISGSRSLKKVAGHIFHMCTYMTLYWTHL